MKAALAFVLVVTLSVSVQPDLDVLIRYAVEFGGAFGGCVMILLPFVLKVIQRLDRQDDVLLALHDRFDVVAPSSMSPGRTLGQAQRSRSGRFKAITQRTHPTDTPQSVVVKPTEGTEKDT